MRVAFGNPLTPDEVSLDRVRQSLLDAAAASLADRISHAKPREPQAWSNGYQLGQINGLQRRQPYTVLIDDPCVERLVGLRHFTSIFKSRPTTKATTHWLGGNKLRQHIATSKPPAEKSIFFDFSDDALTPLEIEGWVHCPCLAINGIIIAMSVPDPNQSHPDSPHQSGQKPGSHGLLLPGFSYREENERIHLTGPSAGPEGLLLPQGTHIDESGFVFTGRVGSTGQPQ